jgi:hypothetical protein
MEILRQRVPGVSAELATRLCAIVSQLRELNLRKPPGIGETLDWASALAVLGFESLDAPAIEESLGAVLKVREDYEEALSTLGLESPETR